MDISPAFLARIKEHLRVTGAAEDDLITVYARAACEYVETFTDSGWPWESVVVGEGLGESPVPGSILAAVLLLVGDLFENREAQSEVDLSANKTVEWLLWPFRY